MQPTLLIERIVRQTTMLIAQLSTAAGIRAPLAQIADQVFLELAREIESQGVGRKVAADMFGLAVRTYQRKVQRLTESASQRNTTLWEAVLEHVQVNDGISRARLDQRFACDEPEQLAAVLNDLVSSGLVYVSGRGTHAIYRALSAEERRALTDSERLETIADLAWLTVYRRRADQPATIAAELAADPAVVDRAIAQLVADGRVERVTKDDRESLIARTFLIPIGAEHGWEAAVYDHFSAMVATIGARLAAGVPRSAPQDAAGGATYTFDLPATHPLRARVVALLADERTRIGALWQQVRDYNAAHPADPAECARVTFYFGQHVAEADPNGCDDSPRQLEGEVA
jgi:hypothetical protein